MFIFLHDQQWEINVFLFSIIKFFISNTEFFTLHCRVFEPKYHVFEAEKRVFEEGVCGFILSIPFTLSF